MPFKPLEPIQANTKFLNFRVNREGEVELVMTDENGSVLTPLMTFTDQGITLTALAQTTPGDVPSNPWGTLLITDPFKP